MSKQDDEWPPDAEKDPKAFYNVSEGRSKGQFSTEKKSLEHGDTGGVSRPKKSDE